MTVRRTRRQRAFTIVEVLVVVIILALLASLIVPKFFGRVGEAKVGAAKSNLAEIEKAIDMFRLDYGRLPQALDELITKPSDIDDGKWHEPALKEKNLIDPWGNAYVYTCPGEHGPYDLSCLGADNQPGGEGDDADINSWE